MDELPSALRSLLATSPVREFAAGESLIDPAQTNSPLWYVHDGLLRLYLLDADGDHYNLGFHGPGELVAGRFALREGAICCAERALGVDALQASRASALSLASLDQLRRDDAELSAWLIERLLHLSAERLGREADLVQRSASDRYRELLSKRPDLPGQVPLHQIAAWLGITAVALSRIRRRLAQQARRPTGRN